MGYFTQSINPFGVQARAINQGKAQEAQLVERNSEEV